MTTWKNLEDVAVSIKQHVPNDEFAALVLDGALMAARDAQNPIRGNLFAAAIRELITHVLHSLAPNANVEACPWFKLVPDARGPTRKQRASYIVQGGISDDFLANELGLDPEDSHRDLLDAMNELNRLTHVQKGTVIGGERAVRDLAERTLSAILTLFESARLCRQGIEAKLEGHVDREVMDKLISETIDDLDILSTHTTVEEHEVETVEVASLNHEFIEYEVSGTVYVELQYGSDSDVENDIGARMPDSYPYSATMRSDVAAPKKILGDSVVLAVDNSSFFE